MQLDEKGIAVEAIVEWWGTSPLVNVKFVPKCDVWKNDDEVTATCTKNVFIMINSLKEWIIINLPDGVNTFDV